jgi:hypothetical protein
MKRRLKTIGKNLIHAQFIFFQRFGIDILPRHFYSEIPDIDKLRRSTDWRKKYSMTGVVGANCDDQLQFLCQTTATNIPQQASVYQTACRENGEAGYGPVEAEFLLHYIVTHRPRSVVQVGAGVSTSVIRQAAAIAGYAPAITCFDPFPTDFLKRLAAERRITLLDIPAQQVDVDVLHQLDAGDLLFIDATHTLGPAGEVTRLVLEWLPRLKPGVRVHFHDITLPYDYPRHILTSSLFFQHETALLYAFLCMNESFRILCSLSMLHHERQRELGAIFPRYRPCANEHGVAASDGDYPSSIFLERTK